MKTQFSKMTLAALILGALAVAGSGCKKSVLRSISGGSGGASVSDISVTSTASSCVITTFFADYWRKNTAEDIQFQCVTAKGKVVKKVECQLDAGSWDSCTTNLTQHLTGLTPGDHVFHVRGKADDDDHDSGVGHDWAFSLDLLWGVDNLPPTIDTVDATPSDTSVVVSFTGHDNPGGSGLLKFECKLNTGSYTTWTDCSSPVTYGGLTAGTNYTFTVRAQDVAGNYSSTAGFDKTFTTTSPPPGGGGGLTACLINPHPNAITNLRTQALAYTCPSTGIVGLECMKDTFWAPCASSTSATMSGLDDGLHVFAVRYRDTGGDAGGTDVVAWVVDATPPTINITGQDVSTLSPSFSFVGSDTGVGIDPASYLCRLEDGGTVVADWTSCSSPKAYTSGIVAGDNYTFKVKVSDLAGNTSAPATYSWMATDGAIPVCTVTTSFPALWRNNASETISYHCSSSVPMDSTSFECLDKGSWVSCGTSSYTVSGLTSGTADNEFRVRAKDMVGHSSAPSAPLTWKTDLVKPTVSVALTLNANPSASFSYSVSDTGGSGPDNTRTECKIDNLAGFNNWHSCQTLYTGFTVNQSYTLSVRGYDIAGNQSDSGASSSVTWTSTPPYSGPECLLTLAQGSTAPWINETSRKYTVACTGPKAIKRIECSYDSGAWAKCVSPLTITTTTSAVRTVAVRGVDVNDVIGPVDTRSWNVDRDAPSVTVTNVTFGSGSQVFFNPQDTGGSGIKSSQCRLEKGTAVVSDWAACTSPFQSPQGDLAGATFTFKVKSTDGAGNVSPVVTKTWTNGGWSDWGTCNASACGGTGTHTRTCSKPAASGGGMACAGVTSEACTLTCPKATNGGWSAWGNCSKSCGGGVQYRTCDYPKGQYLNSKCTAGQSESANCNTQSCDPVCKEYDAGRLQVKHGNTEDETAKCPSGWTRKDQRYTGTTSMDCSWTDKGDTSAKLVCKNPSRDTDFDVDHVYITCCH